MAEDLKKIALEFGEQVYNDIYVSMEDPEKKVTGETLKIYEELKDWGLLSKYPFREASSHEFYVIIIAMQKYRHLKWNKAHPSAPKPSKWDIVTGRASRTRR